jgi:hypothetical protein
MNLGSTQKWYSAVNFFFLEKLFKDAFRLAVTHRFPK